MKNHIKITLLKYPTLKKCECCERVRDVYYKTQILDFDDNDLIVGDLDMCKQCGDNMNKILGGELNLGEKLVKEFTFNK